MKQGQSYPVGTIVSWYSRQRENVLELIEYLGSETKVTNIGEARGVEFYMVYELKVDRSGVKGKPYKFGLLKGMVEGKNEGVIMRNKTHYLHFPKEGHALISAKAIFETKAKENVEAKEIEWEGVKPAYLMTKSEYQKEVTPILKEFRKFLKKNDKQLIIDGYSGLNYLTFELWVQKETLRDRWYKENMTDKEKMDDLIEAWTKRGKSTSKLPDSEYQKYTSFIQQLTPYFGEENISKINPDELNSPKRSIRRAIDKDVYQPLLLDGTITYGNLSEILTSVSLKVPNKLENVATKVVVEKKTTSTIALSKGVSDSFHKKLSEFIRPEMQPFFDRYVGFYKPSLVLFEDWNKANNIEENWQDSFCAAIGNACKMVPTRNSNGTLKLNHKKEPIMVKQCCWESDRVIDSKLINKQGNLNPNWKEELDKNAENHVQDLIKMLSEHLLHYIPQSEAVIIAPELLNARVDSTNKGKIEGDVTLKYKNGFTVTYSLNVIIAGGYNIQIAHYRYLTKPVVNGKTVSQDNLKKLYSEFKPVKENPVKSIDSDFLKQKIEAFELMKSTTKDPKKIEFLKMKIEAFEMMLNNK